AVRAGRELAHRRDRASRAVRVSQDHADADDAVPLAENRRAHLEGLPGHRLRRAAAAVHRRLDVKDRDSSNHPDYATDRGPVHATAGPGIREAPRSWFSPGA